MYNQLTERNIFASSAPITNDRPCILLQLTHINELSSKRDYNFPIYY